jgi:hypothetical protein
MRVRVRAHVHPILRCITTDRRVATQSSALRARARVEGYARMCARARARQVFIQCSACGNRHSEFEAFFHCSCGTALSGQCDARAGNARARAHAGARRCGKLDKAASVMYNIGIGAMVCAVRARLAARPPSIG